MVSAISRAYEDVFAARKNSFVSANFIAAWNPCNPLDYCKRLVHYWSYNSTRNAAVKAHRQAVGGEDWPVLCGDGSIVSSPYARRALPGTSV